jgi:hypothetical protein
MNKRFLWISIRYSFFVVVFLLLKLDIKAQDVLKITTSDNETLYHVVRCGFGPQDITDIKGDLVFSSSSLACEKISDDLTGKIAVVERGVCEFNIKVQNAQKAGAVAVLICQNVTDDPFPGGGTNPNITIPSFLGRLVDCDEIKLAMNNGLVKALFQTNRCDSKLPNNVVWGDISGTGDFDAKAGAFGSDGWTIENDNIFGWEWAENIKITNANRYSVYAPHFSLCNGFVIFDSEISEKDILPRNQKIVLCPEPCTGKIISPRIDLSDIKLEGLYVMFSQILAQHNSKFNLLISFDNGLNWNDTIALNTKVADRGTRVSEVQKIPICNINNKELSQIRIAFHYEGSLGFWAIDNVYLINEASSVPTIEWPYAVFPTFKTPVGHGGQFPLVANYNNLGNMDGDDVVATVQIFNAKGDEEYIQSFEIENLKGCTNEDILLKFPDLYNHPSTPGLYTIEYKIKCNNANDIYRSNHVGTFEITENTYSVLPHTKKLEAISVNYLFDERFRDNTYGKLSLSVASLFYLHSVRGLKATSVRFQIGYINRSSAAFAIVGLYKYVGEDSNNSTIEPNERELIAEGKILITPEYSESSSLIELNLEPLDYSNEFISLEDNQLYILILHWLPFPPSILDYKIFGMKTLSSPQRPNRYNTNKINEIMFDKGKSLLGTYMGIGKNIKDIESRTLHYISDKELFIELNFAPIDEFNSVNNSDVQKEENYFKVFPNPADDKFIIKRN